MNGILIDTNSPLYHIYPPGPLVVTDVMEVSPHPDSRVFAAVRSPAVLTLVTSANVPHGCDMMVIMPGLINPGSSSSGASAVL